MISKSSQDGQKMYFECIYPVLSQAIHGTCNLPSHRCHTFLAHVSAVLRKVEYLAPMNQA